MAIYVDTSALYAVLDADDRAHRLAQPLWVDLLTRDEELVCTNYVLVESFALVQHRLGVEAVRVLQEDIVPVLRVEWIDADAHQSSVTALLAASSRQLSLVDCSSFDTMRRLGINTTFTFDQHFRDQQFICIPG